MENITTIFGKVYQADGVTKKRRIRQVMEGSFVVYCRGSDRRASIFYLKSAQVDTTHGHTDKVDLA